MNFLQKSAIVRTSTNVTGSAVTSMIFNDDEPFSEVDWRVAFVVLDKGRVGGEVN